MPAPIVLSTLTPETKKVDNPPEGQPVIATKAEFRDGSRPTDAPAQGLIFSDDFDSQPDWTSGLAINDLESDDGLPDREQFVSRGHTLPNGWDSARQLPIWAESLGDTGFPENVEILSANSDKATGGSGKSCVVYRQSSQANGFSWWSDGQLHYHFDAPLTEVVVEFDIRFSENWTALREYDPNGQANAKLFRVSSDDVEGNPYNLASGGDVAPIYFWGWLSGDFGVRNSHTFRADPQETNYDMTSPAPSGTASEGDHNYNIDAADLDRDGIYENPITLRSLVDNRLLDQNSGIVWHEDLFGTSWRTMRFRLKMNSAPGAPDGIFQQWMDGQLLVSDTSVPWQGNDSPGNRKWTSMGIGGNSFFHTYPDSEKRTEWRAYDNIKVWDGLPE